MSNKTIRVIAFPAFKNKSTQPYNWLLYNSMRNLDVEIVEFSFSNILLKKYDVFHLHWPEWYLNNPNLLVALSKIVALLFCIVWSKIRGTKIIWTAHNLRSHEEHYPGLENLFWLLFLHLLDGYINLTSDGRTILLQSHSYLNHIKNFVIPHGHYRDFYKNLISREEARQTLRLPENAAVFLFLGSISSYKNVIGLIRTFTGINDPDFHLVIAGKPINEAMSSELHMAPQGNSRVHLYLQYIVNDELQIFLNAADLVVLPFQRILNSGSAILGLSFNKPVLVPALGSLRELQRSVGGNWIYTYSGELSKQVLLDVYSSIVKSEGIYPPDLKVFNWEEIACHTLVAYKDILLD